MFLSRSLLASLVLLGVMATQQTYSQDAEFSQYIFNPVYLNPAFAGSAGGPRFILNYRSQWPALNKAYNTYTVSYDQHIHSINSGIGLQLLSDDQANGLYKQTGFSANYNYLLRVSEKTGLRVGIKAGLLQTRIDWANLLFADQFDQSTATPVNNTGEQLPTFSKKTLVDVGGGLLLYSKKFYLGFGAKHINQPNISLYSSHRSALPIRFLANIGVEIKTKRNGHTYISPNLMYAKQGTFNQIQGHLLIYRGPVIGGMGLRYASQNTDALVFYIGMKKGVFRTVYSYDNTYSNLRGKSGGAHELSVSINFSESKKAAKRQRLKNSIDCPALFY